MQLLAVRSMQRNKKIRGAERTHLFHKHSQMYFTHLITSAFRLWTASPEARGQVWASKLISEQGWHQQYKGT